MRIRWLLPVFVLLACALTGPLVARAGAAEKAIWGPLTLPGGGDAFTAYRDLGVDTVQLHLDWPTAAPTAPRNPGDPSDPAYRWPAEVDLGIARAATSGIQVALLVNRSPGWANGGRSPVDAPDPAAYAAFVAAASRRYRTVRRWMIWGEPNRDDRFLPNAPNSPVGPRAYARVLDAAYGALKAVSRANIVIGGMTWTGGTVKPAPFLQFMRLPNGRPPRLDWYGHNPFPFRFPDLRELNIAGGWRDMSDMDLFADEVKRVYGKSARLWLSEYLVLSDRPSREFESAVSRQAQAQWLTAGFDAADSLPEVAGIGWLGLLDESEAPDSSNYGLLTARGARKPAYEAFKQAPAVRFRPNIKVAKRVTRRRLKRPGLRVVVRPKVSGRIVAELRTRRGRRLIRVRRNGSAGKLRAMRLRRRTTLKRGRYILAVRAARGETVRRTVRVR
jgi:hypothetical protein